MTSARCLSLSAAAAHNSSLLASASAAQAASCLRHSSMCSSTRCTILSIMDVRGSPISFPPLPLACSRTILLSHQASHNPEVHLQAPPSRAMVSFNVNLPAGGMVALTSLAQLPDQN